MRLATGLPATLLMATLMIGAAASGAAADGWYFTAGTGLNYVPDLKITNTRPAVTATTKSDLGMVITAGGGYGFGPVRVEGEFGWRSNDNDTARTSAYGSSAASGDLEPVSVMANVYYDIKTGTAFTPYVGVGVGGVDLSAKLGQKGVTIFDDSDMGLGYQGIAGVAYKINDALSLKADYRYLGTTDLDFSNKAGVGTGTAKVDYESHAFLVGFIYHFGAPAPVMHEEAAAAAPPAPPPPPAPEPAPAAAPATAPAVHQFMVFFDFNKSDITPEARQIIEQAAQAAQSQGTAHIQLTGHTDTVGGVAYNQRLSERRAVAVKKVLVQLGIQTDEIATVGKGKTDLLVPTADGVKEPKNRRVVIELE